MTEADLQRTITDALDWARWRWHHETDSRRTHPGWPDLIAAHPATGRLLVIECKSAHGRVTDCQAAWLDTWAAIAAGHQGRTRVGVVRPAGLDTAIDWIAARTWHPLAPGDEMPLR